jgi:hypothetical protein
MNLLDKYKPGIPRRLLLLVAGCVWTLAGGILITRSLVTLIEMNHHLLLEITIGIILGIGFYLVLFSRISSKHISRITMIKIDNPCFFSFFNLRSYILMSLMIIGGITLRKLEIINHDILYTFYLTMGIPLLISAYRFFYSWVKNRSIV